MNQILPYKSILIDRRNHGICLIVFLVPWFCMIRSLLSETTAPADRTTEVITVPHLVPQLLMTVENNKITYRVALWQMFHTLRLCGLQHEHDDGSGILWEQIEQVLETAKINMANHWPNSTVGGAYQYPLNSKSQSDTDGYFQEFYILFIVDDKSRFVLRAEPHIVFFINSSFIKTKKTLSNFDHLLMESLMSLDSLKDRTTKYPIVAKIDICYGSIKSRWIDYGPMGFSVDVKLVGVEDGKKVEHLLSYSTASNLDPICDEDGNSVVHKNYKPRDTLYYEGEEAKHSALAHGRQTFFEFKGN